MNEVRTDILIVDDNAQDAELVSLALRKHQPGVVVSLAREGAQGLSMLQGKHGSKYPRLILLDLKMPKMDGFEFLSRIKADDKTRLIPVVVLTSSDLDRDIRRAYSLGANSYVVKPMPFDELSQVVRRIGEYWLCVDQGHPLESD